MSTVEAFSAKVQSNRWYLLFVRVGLIVFGLVYGLLGVLILDIAWAGNLDNPTASFYTVLDAVGRRPFGTVMLFVAAAGLLVIALWQVIEALVGYVHLSGVRRFNRRVASAGRALIYTGVGVLALLVALDIAGPGSTTWPDVVAAIMEQEHGRLAVLVAGAVVISIGIGQMGRGFGRIFVDEMVGTPAKWVVVLGTVGYAMLGLSLALIGAHFAWSAISYSPEFAGTMSTMVAHLVDMPLGSVLATVVAAGFFSFAIFCVAWSTQPLHATRVDADSAS